MKVCVVGHFGFGKNFTDGQTVKTHSFNNALRKIYGDDNVSVVDTCGIKRRFFGFLLSLVKALRVSENIVVLPAQNGVRIIIPILNFLNKFYHRKLHYSVIGGWLPTFLEKRAWLENSLKRFDGIYVETQTMQKALCAMGFENVFLVPNFKELDIVCLDSVTTEYQPPYKLCTFSRVMKQKGIEDAIEAIDRVNELYGTNIFSLDIYGPIDDGEREWFSNIESAFPEHVSYKGIVPPSESVGVLKNYFALVFPTRFFTEGVPGTIVDAYAAAVPVISARWESFADVVDDGVSGIGYEFGSVDGLADCLAKIAENPEIILSKKKNCIKKAAEFTADRALKELLLRL